MINISPIVEALILLLAAIITTFIVPWLRSRTTATQMAEITGWVSVAVEAAEQLYKGSGRGEEKKAYVLEFLESKGFTIDINSLDNLIESAVYNLPAQLSVDSKTG